MKILYLDLQNGISGDMFISSLISAGVDKNYLLKNLYLLKKSIQFDVKIEEVKISGISAINFKVISDDNLVQRNLKNISDIILSSELSDNIKKDILNIFNILGEAESKVHNVSIDEIHFHEVGAIDSIIDITAAVLGYHYIKPALVYSTPIHFGKGYVNISHGKVSVPVPAVLQITKSLPFLQTDVQGELVTPTGASIVKYYVNKFSKLPVSTLLNTGYGAGSRTYIIPNCLRTMILETYSENFPDYFSEKIYKIETNIDDSTPEFISGIIDGLYNINALEVYQNSVFMKKNRIGIELIVLTNEKNRNGIIEYLLKNTSTIGVRFNEYTRICLKREILNYKTSFGYVRVKKVFLSDDCLRYKIEFDDCLKIAEQNNLTLETVYNKIKKELNLQ